MIVFGYGACMIAGYPLRQAEGFFSRMLAPRVENANSMAVQDLTEQVVSLHGFTAVRAARHLASRVLTRKPDIVVLQFGSTDVDCAPVHLLPGREGESSIVRDKIPVRPAKEPKEILDGSGLRFPTLLDRFRWVIASLLGFIFQPQPNSDLPEYIDAMTAMVEMMSAENIEIIVLSPFPFAMLYSHRLSRKYAEALKKRLGSYANVTLVDCISVLGGYPISKVVLSDGFHLSPLGHQVLGDHLSGILEERMEVVRNKAHVQDDTSVRHLQDDELG